MGECAIDLSEYEIGKEVEATFKLTVLHEPEEAVVVVGTYFAHHYLGCCQPHQEEEDEQGVWITQIEGTRH